MRPRSVARSVALSLVVTSGVAFADPPAATSASAPATPPASAPATPAAAQKAPPALPPPANANTNKGAAPAKTAKGTSAKTSATKGSKKHKKGSKDAAITGGPIATYPGFRMLDGGGSRVLVALSKKVNVSETKAAGKLTYRIQGVQVPTRNNQRALVTTFFSTPVSRVELVPRDSDVDLVIDAKDTAGVVFRVIESDKGAELQVDFPKVVTSADEKAEAASARSSASVIKPGTSTKSIEDKSGGAE